MNDSRFNSLYLIWLFLMAMVIAVSGCGKKGDPVAYHTKPVPPVSGFKIEKLSEAVVMTWPVQPGLRGVSFFQIEKSSLNPNENGCPGCPKIFDVIAEVPVNDAACYGNQNRECRYTDYNVISGYHYIYRISSCDDKERCEKMSTPAEIKY